MVEQTSSVIKLYNYLEKSDYSIVDVAVSDGVMTIDVDCKDSPGPGLIIYGGDDGLIILRKFIGFKKSAINSNKFIEKINECNNDSLVSNWGFAVIKSDEEDYLQLNIKSYHIGFDKKYFEGQLKKFNEEVAEGMNKLVGFSEGEGFVVLRGIN